MNSLVAILKEKFWLYFLKLYQRSGKTIKAKKISILKNEVHLKTIHCVLRESVVEKQLRILFLFLRNEICIIKMINLYN